MYPISWRLSCAVLLLSGFSFSLSASVDSMPATPIQALELFFPSPHCRDDNLRKEYLEKVRQDSTITDTTQHTDLSAFKELAEIYLETGEYACALALLEQYRALSMKQKDYIEAATAYYDMATVLMGQGKIQPAVESLRKALQLPGLNTAILADIHTALQKAYRLRDNSGSALIHGRLAAQFYRRCASGGNTECATGLAHVLAENGAIQTEKGNLRDARKLIEEAHALLKSTFPDETRPEFSIVFLRLGQLYHKWGEYEEALRRYQRALINAAPGFKESDYRINPRPGSVAGGTVAEAALHGKAEAFREWYRKNKRPEMLERASACYEAGYRVALLRERSPGRRSNALPDMVSRKAYDQNAIETVLLLAQITANPSVKERSFAFAEYSRNLIWAEINNVESIPKPPGKAIQASLPDTSGWSIPLTVLQTELLAKDQALLEYIPGTDKLFIFMVTQSRFEVLTLPLDFPLDNWVQQLRRDIENYPRDGSDKTTLCARYTAQALRLYQKLVLPAEQAFSLPKRLCIIPPGTLAQLPFEALLTDAPAMDCDFKNYPYLLRRYHIGYGFSAGMQYHLARAERRTGSGYLGLGPVFEGRDGMDPLERNLHMLDAAQSILGGKLLLRDEATAANFRQKAGRYGILHIAAPAQSFFKDEENTAFLILADGEGGYDSLFLKDIRDIQLKADLTILSYCRAESPHGEEFMPVGSPFLEAGARSLLPSLWPTGNAEALALLFLENIRAGKLKDEALWEAKIHGLENGDPNLAHPAYWAGALLFGDAGVYEGKPIPDYLIWIGGICILLVGLSFYYQRKKRREGSKSGR